MFTLTFRTYTVPVRSDNQQDKFGPIRQIIIHNAYPMDRKEAIVMYRDFINANGHIDSGTISAELTYKERLDQPDQPA